MEEARDTRPPRRHWRNAIIIDDFPARRKKKMPELPGKPPAVTREDWRVQAEKVYHVIRFLQTSRTPRRCIGCRMGHERPGRGMRMSAPRTREKRRTL